MDIEAQNAILDAILGPDQGATIPATFDFELWVGDPRLAGSVEVSGPGYAAVEISTSASWTTPAAGGVKTRDTPVAFADPTDEWDDVATHWAMRDPGTGALYFVGLLSRRLDVAEAGSGLGFLPRVRAADALILAA